MDSGKASSSASAAALTETAAVHRDDWCDELFDDDDPVGSLDGDKHPAKKHKGGSEVVCLICKSVPDLCKWANYKKTNYPSATLTKS